MLPDVLAAAEGQAAGAAAPVAGTAAAAPIAVTARQAAWSESRRLGAVTAGGAIAGRARLGVISESALRGGAAIAMAAASLADPANERVKAGPRLVSAC